MGAQKLAAPPQNLPALPHLRPIVYDHSLSGNSSQGNYIRKNRNISGIFLNQEEIARSRYVGSLVTSLCFVWLLLYPSLWELPGNGVVKNLQFCP